MKADVEIVVGVALAGKTQQLLAQYRRELGRSVAEGRPGTTLWVSTTARACRQVLDSLLDESLPVSFAPNVFTFESFAERVLQHTEGSWVRVSPSQKRILLRRLVDTMRTAGRLPYFSSISHTSGFLDLVLDLISELKRDEIWPDEFEDACRARGATPKDKELALIYREYQEQLRRHCCYDAEGRFWSARDALQDGRFGPFRKLSLVVVDGFTDFTHTQYEILGCLASAAERLLISLPLEQPLVRSDLFAKSEVALQRIRQTVPGTIRLSLPERRQSRNTVPASLAHVANCLFADSNQVSQIADSDGIDMVAVTGQDREVTIVAERVKRVLLEGVPAAEIVVAFRPLDDYADLVDEVFGAAGIPYSAAVAEPLARTPILKALVRIFRLEHEDWRFDCLMSVLDSCYFRPVWAGPDKAKAVRAVAHELRRLKLHRGRLSILRALAREASVGAAGNDDSESSSRDDAASSAARALSLLEKLSTATQRLRQQAEFATWVQQVVSLARELGIPPDASTSDVADALTKRDQQTWEVFENLLFDAQYVERLFADPSRPMDLWEFATLLEDLLRTERIPRTEGERGKVRVLEADQVRNLDVPYLFLAGMTETSFPGRRDDNCLYGDRERRELNEHGLSLADRASHGQEEMLLFYGVVTRARRHLVLSYPAVSSQGQPLFPSPYLNSLPLLFEPGSLSAASAGDLNPVPQVHEVLTPAQLRLVATKGVREKRPGLFREMMEHPSTAETARNILASVRLNTQRFHTRGFTSCEGMLSSPESQRRLGHRFPADYQFSATQLEDYAVCPFRFLLSDVLKITPPEPPEAFTDYRTRGTVVHEVLATIHEGLTDSRGGTPLAEAELVSRFQERVKSLLKRRLPYTKLQEALLRIEERLLSEWGEAYGRQWTEYVKAVSATWNQQPVPVCGEVAFGDVPGEKTGSTESKFGYVTFGTGDGQTYVRGRIDRVDVGELGSQRVYTVIDYKTGRFKTFGEEDVATGRAIQLALYLLAVRRLEIVGADVAPFQMGYWSLKETGFVPGWKKSSAKKLSRVDAAVLQTLEETLEALIPRLAREIRTGSFPVYNQDVHCTEGCEYSTVCRVGQIRSLEQSLDKKPPEWPK